MQPVLDETFMQSAKWKALSPSAQCALKGLLQFATRRHCDWVVEGTAKQLGEWIGPESSLSSAAIVTAIRELDLAGCIRRGRYGNGNGFIVAAPLADR